MEMEALWFGESEKAFFKFDDLQNNRKLGKAYYPYEIMNLVGDKGLGIEKKQKDELRLLTADIATMGGNANDASAFFIIRLIPTKTGYERQIVYSENIEGGHTGDQALRIRQLFYDFDCDYIVLDTQNAGIGIFDQLVTPQVDKERGTEYEALNCINDERLMERCVYSNAPKVIYSIRASGQLNSEIAVLMRDTLRRGKMKLLIPEIEAEEILKNNKSYMKQSEETKLQLRMPYIQTSLLVNEMMNLEYERTDSGLVKLTEQRSSRKDRYSSLSYGNYIANQLEIKLNKKPQEFSISDYFLVKQAKFK